MTEHTLHASGYSMTPEGRMVALPSCACGAETERAMDAAERARWHAEHCAEVERRRLDSLQADV